VQPVTTEQKYLWVNLSQSDRSKEIILCPHTRCEDVSFLFNVAESAGAVTCSTHIPPFPRIASVTDDCDDNYDQGVHKFF
jgi:hypothetical protein